VGGTVGTGSVGIRTGSNETSGCKKAGNVLTIWTELNSSKGCIGDIRNREYEFWTTRTRITCNRRNVCGNVCNYTVYIYIYTGCPRRNVPEFGRVFLIFSIKQKLPSWPQSNLFHCEEQKIFSHLLTAGVEDYCCTWSHTHTHTHSVGLL